MTAGRLGNGRKSLAQLTSLSKIQETAVFLLSEGLTGKQVADKLQVRPNTISKWLHSFPLFKERLQQIQNENWTVCAGISNRAARAALIYSARVIGDESLNTRDRLSAGATVLNHQRALAELSLRTRQLAAVEERLKAIEARQQQHAQDAEYTDVHVLSPAP